MRRSRELRARRFDESGAWLEREFILQEKKGDRAAATREYEAALSLEPKSAAARDALKRLGPGR